MDTEEITLMSNRIETIKAFHARRGFGTRDNLRTAQHEVAAAYRSLSPEESSTLAEFPVEIGDEDILSHLACFQPGSLSGLHLELVRKGVSFRQACRRRVGTIARRHAG